VHIAHLGDGVTGAYLSRAHTADFMLKHLRSDEYIGKAPAVADA